MRFVKVAGCCPMGCGATLFLGDGGYPTCSWRKCPRPSAAAELLELPTDHYVVFDEQGWTLEHPARERIEGGVHTCAVHQYMRSLNCVPVQPGRYRVLTDGQGAWTFERRGALRRYHEKPDITPAPNAMLPQQNPNERTEGQDG